MAIRSSKEGRRHEVVQLLEKVVAASRRTLAEEHPGTLGSVHQLAIRYSQLGRRVEAPQQTERVVAARSKTLGKEHLHTLASMHELANC
jgi:hypothetical protein